MHPPLDRQARWPPHSGLTPQKQRPRKKLGNAIGGVSLTLSTEWTLHAPTMADGAKRCRNTDLHSATPSWSNTRPLIDALQLSPRLILSASDRLRFDWQLHGRFLCLSAQRLAGELAGHLCSATQAVTCGKTEVACEARRSNCICDRSSTCFPTNRCGLVWKSHFYLLQIADTDSRSAFRHSEFSLSGTLALSSTQFRTCLHAVNAARCTQPRQAFNTSGAGAANADRGTGRESGGARDLLKYTTTRQIDCAVRRVDAHPARDSRSLIR